MFFAICGLDVLNSMNLVSPKLREDIINWTYGGLVVPRDNEKPCGGFMVSINCCCSPALTIARYDMINKLPGECKQQPISLYLLRGAAVATATVAQRRSTSPQLRVNN